MQKRFEVTVGRIYVQVSDLVEVRKTASYPELNINEPARISWASTSNKPAAAGAREFAAEIIEAAEIAEALDVFTTKQQLADAMIEQTGKVKKFAVIPPTATAPAIIYVPLGWFVYAPAHIAD